MMIIGHQAAMAIGYGIAVLLVACGATLLLVAIFSLGGSRSRRNFGLDRQEDC